MNKSMLKRQYVRRPLLAIVIVLTSAGATLNGLHYQAMMADQAIDARHLQEMDAALVALKARVAAEKSVQEKVQQEAKIASSTALEQGTAPAPNPLPSSAGGPHTDPSQIDVVVNKKRPVNPVAYAPTVVSVDCAGNGSAVLNPQVSADFTAMCQAAVQNGTPLGVSSSYRSYSTQIGTYNHWVSISGVEGADLYSARPGYSEHQTGFAIDFMVPNGAALSDFTGTAQQLWLSDNAHRFGFIQRYTESNSVTTGYKAETWHYRYVGRATAEQYKNLNIGSLEQLWGVPGGLY